MRCRFYVENQVKPAAMSILESFGVNEKQLAARLSEAQLPRGESLS